MTIRAVGIASVVIGALAAVCASPARSASVEIDLTISLFSPSNIPGNPILPDLTEGLQFWSTSQDIGTMSLIPGNPIIGPLSQGQTFSEAFILYPPSPCFGATSCQIGFSFGHTNGSIFAIPLLIDAPPQPSSPPINWIVSNFEPPDPCIQDAACQTSGRIFNYDAGVAVGTWDVTIEAATPLPGALPLFASGLGALGLLGWRRKRKQAA